MKESTFEYAEDIISKAIMFAISAHSGQQRKGSRTPAIIHAMEAATIASTLTEDNDVIAAALLHDTVEDTDVTPEQILKMFGAKIAELVASETEDKHHELPAEESWMIRKEETISRLKASDDKNIKILWMSDKLSNIRSFYRLRLKYGDRMWDDFHQKDVNKQYWYYSEIAKALIELENTPAYCEYVDLVNKTFER